MRAALFALSLAACVVEIPDVVPETGGGGSGGGAGGEGGGAAPPLVLQRIAAGSDFSCAIRDTSGRVFCWGSTAEGVVPLDGPAFSTDPVPVDGAIDVVEVTAGAAHACALEASTRVICWGNNMSSQLGRGAPTPNELPGPVQRCVEGVCADLVGVRTVRAGQGTTCALLDDGTVVCWGLGDLGQTGTGDDGDVPAAGPPVSFVTEASLLAVGASHACVRVSEGTRCWGANQKRQLGSTAVDAAFAPAAVLGPTTPYVYLALGRETSCAITSEGAMECWGAIPPAGGLAEPVPQPFPITGASRIALSGHGCAAHLDGTLTCFGTNDLGQVGDGMPTGEPVGPTPIAGLPFVKEVAAGSAHTCIEAEDGSVICWGACSAGQLGRTDCLASFADTPGPAVVFPE